MRPRDLDITTRFARDAEFAEMESHSAADAAIWRATGDDKSYNQAKIQEYISKGLWHFAFRRLSEKQNKK